MRNTVIIAMVISALLLVKPAAANSVLLLDFERFPGSDGLLGSWDDQLAPQCPPGICRRLGTEYATMGIVFTSGTLGSGALFPGTTPDNHFVTSTPLDVTLDDIGVIGVSIKSYSVWSATLYALDASSNVVASDAITNPQPGSFFAATFSVSSNTRIRRFTVLPLGCSIGQDCAQIMNLDDVTLILAAPVQTQTQNGALAGPPTIPTLSEFGIVAMVLLLGLLGSSAAAKRFP